MSILEMRLKSIRTHTFPDVIDLYEWNWYPIIHFTLYLNSPKWFVSVGVGKADPSVRVGVSIIPEIPYFKISYAIVPAQ